MYKQIQMRNWRALALALIVPALNACGSNTLAPDTGPAPVGTALNYTQTQNIFSTTGTENAFAPGIPYGGIWLKDQASLDAFWSASAGTSAQKPAVDFTTQSVLAYSTNITYGYVLNVTRVSEQQVVVGRTTYCGGLTIQVMVYQAVVIIVQGTLSATPRFDVWTPSCSRG